MLFLRFFDCFWFISFSLSAVLPINGCRCCHSMLHPFVTELLRFQSSLVGSPLLNYNSITFKRTDKPEVMQSVPVTKQEATVAFMHMLRCAFSTIAYLRGFCEETTFQDFHLNGIPFKRMVRGDSQEAQRLFDWLEEGVLPTFRLGFLESVTLQAYQSQSSLVRSALPLMASSSSQKSSRLVLTESYTFSFEYNSNDGMPMLNAQLTSRRPQPERGGIGALACSHISSQKILTESQAACDAPHGVDANIITKEALRLTIVSILTQISQVTQEMPLSEAGERSISFRIGFVTGATPPDFNPSHFQPLQRSDVIHDMVRERQLSVTSRCRGQSGHHGVEVGVAYMEPEANDEGSSTLDGRSQNDEVGDDINSMPLCETAVATSSAAVSSNASEHQKRSGGSVLGMP